MVQISTASISWISEGKSLAKYNFQRASVIRSKGSVMATGSWITWRRRLKWAIAQTESCTSLPPLADFVSMPRTMGSKQRGGVIRRVDCAWKLALRSNDAADDKVSIDERRTDGNSEVDHLALQKLAIFITQYKLLDNPRSGDVIVREVRATKHGLL